MRSIIASLIFSTVLAAPASEPNSPLPDSPTFPASAYESLPKRGGCADVTVIFARGTFEFGTMGSLVGPQWAKALEDRLGSSVSVDVQGVEYSASQQGFLAGGDADGSETMAEMTTAALTACPSANLVLSGYSQGAQLVHNAAQLLPAATTANISSVVLFGDPDYPTAVDGVETDRQMVICHSDDNICSGGTTINTAHLTYAGDVDEAAEFAVGRMTL